MNKLLPQPSDPRYLTLSGINPFLAMPFLFVLTKASLNKLLRQPTFSTAKAGGRNPSLNRGEGQIQLATKDSNNTNTTQISRVCNICSIQQAASLCFPLTQPSSYCILASKPELDHYRKSQLCICRTEKKDRQIFSTAHKQKMS